MWENDAINLNVIVERGLHTAFSNLVYEPSCGIFNLLMKRVFNWN